MPPFDYFTPRVLWFLWCLSVLHHHAIVFPLQDLYGHLHDPAQQHSLLWTFLQWFDSLSYWRTQLTKLMGQYNIWKLDPDTASSVSCIWIFHRPYRYNPHKKLLWTHNVNYEWHTTFNYLQLYPTKLQTPLLNFLCDVNGVYTDECLILPDVPRDSTKSWPPSWNPPPEDLPDNPVQDSQDPVPEDFFQDSQDPMALDSQTNFWPCWICGATDSDDEDHVNCNLSTTP